MCTVATLNLNSFSFPKHNFIANSVASMRAVVIYQNAWGPVTQRYLFHLLVHPPNVYNSHDCIRLKPEARNSILISEMSDRSLTNLDHLLLLSEAQEDGSELELPGY